MTWWTPRPYVVGAIVLSATLYAAGAVRTWGRAGVGHGVRVRDAVAFAAGNFTVLMALVSPVDRLSELMFSVHMSQHELLMVVAAPLLVMGQPIVGMLWGLPDDARRVVARAGRH